MCATRVRIETWKALEPVASLPEARPTELVGLCHVETASKNSDPFLVRGIADQAVYLLRGELVLTYPDGSSEGVGGGSERSRYPLGRRGDVFTSAKAVTDIELMRINDDLLDVMATWDEAASAGHAEKQERQEAEASSLANWTLMSGMFSVSSLKYGEFSRLPPAHINELLRRFERINVKKGDAVIREGAEGDFYFVIETGRCKVERTVGGVSMLLAELKSGDAFGEEALVSEAKRNATVTMKTDGVLLRLSRKDFAELLREPLLHGISAEEARDKAAHGAPWGAWADPSGDQ